MGWLIPDMMIKTMMENGRKGTDNWQSFIALPMILLKIEITHVTVSCD